MLLHVMLLASGFLNVVLFGTILVHHLTHHGKPAMITWDGQAERVTEFFRVIAPLLEILYPIVDSYRAPTGRPPVCHRFQLRFLIFYLVFWKGRLHDAREAVNQRPALQEALHMPVPVYHGSTLSRFLQRLGTRGLAHLIAATVMVLVKHGLFTLHHLIIDTCPLYSPINFKKHAKRCRLTMADLGAVLEGVDWHFFAWLAPRRRGRKTPWKALAALAVLRHGIVSLSTKKVHELCTKMMLPDFYTLLGERLPSYPVSSRYLRHIMEDDANEGVRWLLACKIHEFLAMHGVFATGDGTIEGWEDARGFLTSSLHGLDPGARVNYCASKEQWYFGRGAFVITEATTELPVFVHVEPQVKVTPHSLTRALTSFREAYRGQLPRAFTLYGDHEFMTRPAREVIARVFPGAVVMGSPSSQSVSSVIIRRVRILRLAVERCIGRLSLAMAFQHPHVRGTARVVSMTSFTVLASLVVAAHAVLSGKPRLIRSLAFLRR